MDGAKGLMSSLFSLRGAIAGGGLVLAVRDVVGAFGEMERGQAQLDAVLRSTKGAAGLAKEEINAMAAALQKSTTFSDDAVLGAQNLLLTFTRIGRDVFPSATGTVLDMSQALGQDLKSSAIQLGKALQDPIEGITALRRVGVNFTDAQEGVIKALVETGRSADAQRLILAELRTEFGGSAAAAAKTYTGQLAQMRNEIDDLKEEIGGALAPELVKLGRELLRNKDAAVEFIRQDLPGILTQIGSAAMWAAKGINGVAAELSAAYKGADSFLNRASATTGGAMAAVVSRAKGQPVIRYDELVRGMTPGPPAPIDPDTERENRRGKTPYGWGRPDPLALSGSLPTPALSSAAKSTAARKEARDLAREAEQAAESLRSLKEARAEAFFTSASGAIGRERNMLGMAESAGEIGPAGGIKGNAALDRREALAAIMKERTVLGLIKDDEAQRVSVQSRIAELQKGITASRQEEAAALKALAADNAREEATARREAGSAAKESALAVREARVDARQTRGEITSVQAARERLQIETDRLRVQEQTLTAVLAEERARAAVSGNSANVVLIESDLAGITSRRQEAEIRGMAEIQSLGRQIAQERMAAAQEFLSGVTGLLGKVDSKLGQTLSGFMSTFTQIMGVLNSGSAMMGGPGSGGKPGFSSMLFQGILSGISAGAGGFGGAGAAAGGGGLGMNAFLATIKSTNGGARQAPIVVQAPPVVIQNYVDEGSIHKAMGSRRGRAVINRIKADEE
jgi:hypothetical protein